MGAVPASFDRARSITESTMRASVQRLAPELIVPIQYHLGWADRDGKLRPGGGGKGVRPALAVLSAEAVGAPAATGVPGGVAIELIHNFSLLHDDVIDGDEERRHRRTVWAEFGVGAAVIAGDALVMLALQVVLDGTVAGARAATVLVDATDAMIAGQAADMANESRADVTLEECLAMADGKTGALLGAAASIGAVLADADASAIEALAAFGHHLGLAFQAVDDLLGIWGRPEVTGKAAWSDLYQQKKSIPIVFALTRGNGTSEELQALFAAGAREEQDLVRAAELVERCGGRELTESIAREQFELAVAALDQVTLESTARAELVEVAEFVTTRDF